MVKHESHAEGRNVSEWVRGLIRERLSQRAQKEKRDLGQAFRRLSLPAPPIDQLIREIEEGRS